MIKRITAVLLTAILLISVFSGCTARIQDSDNLKIVCTVFPYYDWVRNIVKGTENTEIVLLLNTGTDLHSYQPTAEDIVTISSADIFIYTGGTSDAWVNDVLGTSRNEKTKVMNLCELLGEDKLYCVEEAGEEGHRHEEDGHNHTRDEHIWLSLNNAVTLTEAIAAAIIEKDPENKDLYEQNCLAYVNELKALDGLYKTAVDSAEKDTVVFADRFPFIYLIKDYKLSYFAAFSGCSAESEASFETVTRLAGKINELGLSYILITETSDGSVADTVKNSTSSKNQEILIMNAIQSVTKNDLDKTYIEIMKDNLEVLKKALS